MIARTFQRYIPLSAIALASAAFLSLGGCSKGGPEAHAATEGGAPPPPPVSVAAVVAKSVVEHQEFSGRIEAVDSAEIRARVGGTIESVHFKSGALVKKGDVLFIIDQRPYQAEAQRSVAAAASSRARADLAAKELERSKRLLADNAIAQRDFDERAASQRQLEAAAKADEAAATSANLNLQYATIRAPFDGRVGKAEVTVGNLVDASRVLTTLVSIQPVYVSFDADEATYLALGPGARNNPAGVQVNAGLTNEQGYPHAGRLEFVDNRIDPATGSVRMRAIVDNKERLLTPGLYARVQVGASNGGAAVPLINDVAVGTDQNRKYVYVIGADNKAEYRVVQLGPVVDGLRVVRGGLKDGERIVVAGLQRVRPGAPVTPQAVPMSGAASAAAAGGAPAAAQ